MRDLFKKGLSVGLGLASASKDQAERVLDELVEKGQLSKEESNNLLKDLRMKGEESQKQFDEKIKRQLKTYLDELEVPTKETAQALEDRIEKLEEQVNKEE
ncbi:phasin family protein [Piscibacillus salipiscarius]|uniref:Phasin family protein n=1 Tax=Piscibacillus salipiscarius TaxID=299480 RepID=A0ABW5QB68_9BACI|nr:hypothetical protein [Piscibacillus salipiscarius]